MFFLKVTETLDLIQAEHDHLYIPDVLPWINNLPSNSELDATSIINQQKLYLMAKPT